MLASVAVDTALLALKIAFLVLLYVFIWRIVRTASRDLRLPQESFILAPSAAAGLGAARPTLHSGRLVVVSSPDLTEGDGFELNSAQLTSLVSLASPAAFSTVLSCKGARPCCARA